MNRSKISEIFREAEEALDEYFSHCSDKTTARFIVEYNWNRLQMFSNECTIILDFEEAKDETE